MPIQPLAPTRTAGLTHLNQFLPHAGRDYAAKRNYDRGPQGHPDVSCLSPYIRARVVTEAEVLEAVLGRFSLSTAEKFIQEVFWRTYWKGWLELRPGIWGAYRNGAKGALNRLSTESGLRSNWEAACKGETDIECFNVWANELVQTGYLHNHARMWFASIWIFTLRLPWELGADFFMRHLLDGDPASNTLSWRWVAGLQTQGKNYVATATNIHKFTDGRFQPGHALASNPAPLKGPSHPDRGPVPQGDLMNPDAPTVMLLHDDDLSPGFILDQGVNLRATAFVQRTAWRTPLEMAPNVMDFVSDLATDCFQRYGEKLGQVSKIDMDQVLDWAESHDAHQIVTPFAPVGPNADMVRHLTHKAADRGMDVIAVLRPYDALCWPHATHGFFRFKEKIPKLIEGI